MRGTKASPWAIQEPFLVNHSESTHFQGIPSHSSTKHFNSFHCLAEDLLQSTMAFCLLHSWQNFCIWALGLDFARACGKSGHSVFGRQKKTISSFRFHHFLCFCPVPILLPEKKQQADENVMLLTRNFPISIFFLSFHTVIILKTNVFSYEGGTCVQLSDSRSKC